MIRKGSPYLQRLVYSATRQTSFVSSAPEDSSHATPIELIKAQPSQARQEAAPESDCQEETPFGSARELC